MIQTARVADYPDLRKSGASVVNVSDGDYQRALARLNNQREAKDLRNRVNSLEKKLDMIIAALGIRNGN